jgi:hypothetical protein
VQLLLHLSLTEGTMPLPKFITIDGKRFAWRDVLQRRREQREACAEPEQPTLFAEGVSPAGIRAHRRRPLPRAQSIHAAGWGGLSHDQPPRRCLYPRDRSHHCELQRGVRPWHTAVRITRPLRANGQPYKGINVLMLWGEAMEKGFACLFWMTYRQAQELGAQVRKGEQDRSSSMPIGSTRPVRTTMALRSNAKFLS